MLVLGGGGNQTAEADRQPSLSLMTLHPQASSRACQGSDAESARY